MSNEIKSYEMDNKELVRVLGNSLYPGASEESISLAIGYCRASGLDPIQKPVHIVPMWNRNLNCMRDVIMPGIGLYRIMAARSGCAGVSEPEYGEDVTEKIGGIEITYPKWCKIIVKRALKSGVIADFSAKEFWKENYAVRGGKEKSIAPNAMWFKRPYGQIAKCAEAQALRKGFPECGAAPTADEMEGKTIDITDQATMTNLKDVEVLKEPEFYPDEDFNSFLPNWKKQILSGDLTVSKIIEKIPNLTPEQVELLELCKPIEGEVI